MHFLRSLLDRSAAHQAHVSTGVAAPGAVAAAASPADASRRTAAPPHSTRTSGLWGWLPRRLGGSGGHVATTAPAAVAPSVPAAAAGSSPGTAHAPRVADRPGSLKVAIVGDIHGAWNPRRDAAALRLLSPDVTLLVGDFGNEHVELVRLIASLDLPKAVILGNHDAWFTMTSRGVARRAGAQQQMSAAELLAAHVGGHRVPGPEEQKQDGVRRQLAALGPDHVGYGTKQLDEQGYTVMGARPFSKGGNNFSSIRDFMTDLYGVTSMDESAQRIVQVAGSAPSHHALIVMGHNGPSGLGDRAHDICGVDWVAKGGDHGDPDLQAALSQLHAQGRHVALVTFGHMHHTIKGPGNRFRRMVALDPTTRTVYLNSATVPRITRPTPRSSSSSSSTHGSPKGAASGSSHPPASPKAYGSGKRARVLAKAAAAAVQGPAAAVAGFKGDGGAGADEDALATVHHFVLAELEAGEVVTARDVWVQVTPVTDESEAWVTEAAEAVVEEGSGEGAGQGVVGARLGNGGSHDGAVSMGAGEGDGAAAELSADGDTEDMAAAAAAAEAAEAAAAEAPSSSEGGDVSSGGSNAVGVAPLPGPRRIEGYVVHVQGEKVVLRTVAGEDGGVVKFVWNAYDQQYEPVVLGGAGPYGNGVGGGARVEAAEARVGGEKVAKTVGAAAAGVSV